MSNSILQYINPYPDKIGKRFAFVCKATGPKSYDSTNKDILTLPGYQHTHRTRSSESYHHGQRNIYLTVKPSVADKRAVWKATWTVTSGGSEVTNATDLSAETFLISGLGGQY